MRVIEAGLNELYRIFHILNKDKFRGVLDEPVITIQKTSGRTLGHFTNEKVWKKVGEDPESKEGFYEINIDPRWLNERSVVETVGTLLHEMVHYYNKVNGVVDCNKGRHNKKFKTEAERVGLVVEKGGSVGYGYTSVSPELEQYIIEQIKPDVDAIGYYLAGTIKKEKPKPISFRFTCPECGCVVRGKSGAKLTCGKCNIQLDKVEEEDDGE